MLRSRAPQRPGTFVAGDPQSGYYNDLRPTLPAVQPDEAMGRLTAVTADRATANPVTVAQIGLASWQRRTEDARWLEVAHAAAAWLISQMREDGGVPYLYPMPHTYPLAAPWLSAMAQGQIASLLVRTATTADDEHASAARAAARTLLDESSPLVAATGEGPVLEEYPTTPRSYVLNGWIFALWGLYDVAATGEEAAAHAFAEGLETLVRRLDRYDAGGGWSRYDLYPHRIVHVATPFYHRLHIAQLEATASLTGSTPLADKARAWERGASSTTTTVVAVGRKIAFRLLSPRHSVRA